MSSIGLACHDGGCWVCGCDERWLRVVQKPCGIKHVIFWTCLCWWLEHSLEEGTRWDPPAIEKARNNNTCTSHVPCIAGLGAGIVYERLPQAHCCSDQVSSRLGDHALLAGSSTLHDSCKIQPLSSFVPDNHVLIDTLRHLSQHVVWFSGWHDSIPYACCVREVV